MRTAINILTALFLASMSVPGYAANYAETITVGKTGANFTSPVTAMASITNATAEAPVLVKIQAGTYDLGKETLQLKGYVDVEGDGADKTILTAMIVSAGEDSCNAGVVKMANNSAIRKISIVNHSPAATSDSRYVGIIFNNVKARADRIRVEVGSDKDSNSNNIGLCISGADSLATSENAEVEVRTGSGGSASAVTILEDGNVNISGSRLAALALPDSVTRVVDCTNGMKFTGVLNISNSQVQGSIAGAQGMNRGIDSYDCKSTIVNSTITLTGGDENHGVVAGGQEILITSSRIYSPLNAILSEDGSTVKASDSLLRGRITHLKGVSLKGNYDENKVPIADR